MTRDAAFDPVRIVEVLTSHRVEFVLVGGYAALLYGARRPTYDVDITPSTVMENLQRLSWRCPHPPTLEYGQIQTLGSLSCDSETVGITCIDNNTGHYFSVSRETVHLG